MTAKMEPTSTQTCEKHCHTRNTIPILPRTNCLWRGGGGGLFNDTCYTLILTSAILSSYNLCPAKQHCYCYSFSLGSATFFSWDHLAVNKLTGLTDLTGSHTGLQCFLPFHVSKIKILFTLDFIFFQRIWKISELIKLLMFCYFFMPFPTSFLIGLPLVLILLKKGHDYFSTLQKKSYL